MADKTITGIVTWLKGWFYDKDEITTKENALQTQINNKASQSDLNSLSSTVSGKLDASAYVVDSALSSSSENPVQNKVLNTALGGKANSSHTHTTAQVTEASALSNLGTSANATQHTINDAINTAIGNLTGAEIIKVVTSLPTASASTMNALYLLSSNSQYDIYITVESSGSYSWEKLDDDVLSDLSIAWSDVTGKPSSFTPTSHSSTATTYGVGTSSNYGHNKIIDNLNQSTNQNGYSLSAHQGYVLNQSKAGKSQVIDWDTLTLVPKATDETGAITFDYLE